MLATLRNTWLAALALLAVSWEMKGSLPLPAKIRTELRREPAQSGTGTTSPSRRVPPAITT